METKIKYFHMEETTSTSAVITELESQCPAGGMLVVWADYQSAGRGQRGNKWVSAKGQNLLFSVLLRPQGVSVDRQFRLSQAMAIAEASALTEIVRAERKSQSPLSQSETETVKIKWPNDLYYGYRKLGGTIIETTLRQRSVARCVLGMGINVNQQTFPADAPNPVSLFQIIGREWDRESLLCAIIQRFVEWERRVEQGDDVLVAEAYRQRLLWSEGFHSYVDKDGLFSARMVDIQPDGHLILEDSDGRTRSYLFKEVKHVFPTVISE